MKTIPLTGFQFLFILLFGIMSISIEFYIHAIYPLLNLFVFTLGLIFMIILLCYRFAILLSDRVKFK